MYYFLESPLADSDGQHYSFSTGLTNLPVIWARGATTLRPSNAPQPQFTQVNPAAGVAKLSISNLTVSVTNDLQFTNSLNPEAWTTLTNMLMQPPCGTNSLTWFTTLTVARTNPAAGFWRIKQ